MLSFFAGVGALTCLCALILIAMYIKHHFEEKAMFGASIVRIPNKFYHCIRKRLHGKE